MAGSIYSARVHADILQGERVMGVVLGILLVFRSAFALRRFWEARHHLNYAFLKCDCAGTLLPLQINKVCSHVFVLECDHNITAILRTWGGIRNHLVRRFHPAYVTL